METPRAFEPVEIVLDRKRVLRFGMGALRRAQARLRELRGDNVNILVLLSPTNREQLGPDELVVLFHQGLLKDDPTLTEEQVDDLLDVRWLDQNLALKLAEALGGVEREIALVTCPNCAHKFTPKSEDEKSEAHKRPLASSPGAISGPSGESS
jgi:hypothetical protein